MQEWKRHEEKTKEQFLQKQSKEETPIPDKEAELLLSKALQDKKFLPLNEEPEILKSLLKKTKTSEILEYLELFSPKRQNEILVFLYSKEHAQNLLLYDLWKKTESLSFISLELAKEIIKKEDATQLFKLRAQWDNFDESTILDYLEKIDRYKDIAWNLDRLFLANGSLFETFLKKQKGMLLDFQPMELAQRLTKTQRYDALLYLMRWLHTPFPFTPERANQQLKNLYLQGNRYAASAFLRCMEYAQCDSETDPAFKESVLLGAQQEQQERSYRKERSTEVGEHNILQEILEFYANEHVRHHILVIRQELKKDKESVYSKSLEERLSVREQIVIQDIEQRLNKEVERLRQWIKLYLFQINVDELFTDEHRVSDFLVPLFKGANAQNQKELFSRYATDEEIRQFLHEAIARFRDFQSTDHGDDPWSVIATHTEELWQEHSPSYHRITLDHLFDLEHHGANVFNKMPERIANVQYLKILLDIKKETNSLKELLAKTWKQIPTGIEVPPNAESDLKDLKTIQEKIETIQKMDKPFTQKTNS